MGPVRLGAANLEGDRQADLHVHGGPDQAVLAYCAEHYQDWRRELEREDVGPGGFAENFTISGLSEDTACVGDLFEVGDALVQVSHPRGPCWKIERRWGIPGLLRRVEESGRCGWYMRVVREGTIEAGQPMHVVSRPNPAWNIRRAARVMRKPGSDPQAAAELAAIETFPDRYRKRLFSRT